MHLDFGIRLDLGNWTFHWTSDPRSRSERLLDLGISLDLELDVRETTFHWTSNSDLGNLSRQRSV